MMWQAVEAVFVIFIMIGAGIFVSWKKWVSEDVAKAFPKLIIFLALPCTVITSFTTYVSSDQLRQSWLPLSIIFVVVPVTFLMGKLVAIICRIPKTRHGVFTVLFSFSNSVFIGFPVARALFVEGMPFAVFYYLANTTFFWVLGYYVIRKDADLISGKHTKVSVKEIVKKLITPPMITILVMVVVVLSGLRLPNIILKPAEYIGGLTSPLSLMFMGCMIYNIGFRDMKYEKGIGAVLFGRFILIPIFCFAVCTLVILFVPDQSTTIDMALMRKVFTMQIGLPVMTQTVILSEMYGADVKYATKNVVWTTTISLISIPAYWLLLQYI